MRKILLLLCVVGISGVLLAQGNHGSWARLNGLKPGEKIQVVDKSSAPHAGEFVSVSDSAISYKDGAGEQTIQKDNVRSVKLAHGSNRLRNTLIGAGVGAGAGAGITAGAWEPHGFLGGRGTGAAVGAVIGALGGAVVGVLLPSHDTLYSVRSH